MYHQFQIAITFVNFTPLIQITYIRLNRACKNFFDEKFDDDQMLLFQIYEVIRTRNCNIRNNITFSVCKIYFLYFKTLIDFTLMIKILCVKLIEALFTHLKSKITYLVSRQNLKHFYLQNYKRNISKIW